MVLRIATRKSALALKQAHWVKDTLLKHHPGLDIQILGITTSGDKLLGVPLATLGGKGLFIKELEQAMLEDKADLAVHSIKDVPAQLAPGLTIAAICEREDPRDVLISHQAKGLMDLAPGAKIGTSSLRRQCQILALRSDLQIESLRGNVNTRLDRLEAGNDLSAIVLAAAGMHRLNLHDRISQYLAINQLLPAVGQGALGIECRSNDQKTQALLAPLEHAPTRDCIMAERALNRHLAGGCQVPIAAYADLQNDQLILQGLVGTIDGKTLLRTQTQGPRQAAEQIGIEAANALIAQGAKQILQGVYQQYGNPRD